MEKRPLVLIETSGAGCWYVIPVMIWAFITFVRMAIRQSDILVILGLVGIAGVFLWFMVHTIIQSVRAGKQPTEEQQRAAIRAMWSPVLSVIWAGFAAGCIASMIVVIELNDPFTKEAVDRVVQEHMTLFWAVVGAGVLIGAGGRIWSLSRPGRVAAAQKEDVAGSPQSRIDC